MTRAGHVALIGKPNAGKSTLLNALLGQKLAITSPKPQSTRVPAVGILSTADAQLILLDTPGLLDPAYALQRSLLHMATEALAGADVAVLVHDLGSGPPPAIASLLPEGTRLPPRQLVFGNKADTITAAQRAHLEAGQPAMVTGAAAAGQGIDALVAAIASALPESPFLFPDDELSTQPMRFFAAEAIREAAFELLHEEVPYGVLVDIDEYLEQATPLTIRATIYVERDSQKGIVIGAKGAGIRALGTSARAKLEALVEAQVFLDLRVKVLPNWRRNVGSLKRFGFALPTDR